MGEHTAILYYASRQHAGDNRQRLLAKRALGLAKPLAMSDALTSHAVADDAMVMRCHCLAQGRRQLSDLAAVFPHACQGVLEVSRQVCEHDEQARIAPLSPEARLADHQAQSQPLMAALKTWLDRQLEERLGEPNSALGQALGYLQNHWATLTRFVSIPGAPLDHNLAERVLKLGMRQRNNALFFPKTHSASLASVRTSLIATGVYAGINAVDSLGALQEPRAEVWAHPAAWWPWTYQARLGPPEATRRQSCAICARAGAPFHRTMTSARAAHGTRTSGVVGHQRKRPGASLFIIIPYPWPSESKRVSAVPARLRTT